MMNKPDTIICFPHQREIAEEILRGVFDEPEHPTCCRCGRVIPWLTVNPQITWPVYSYCGKCHGKKKTGQGELGL